MPKKYNTTINGKPSYRVRTPIGKDADGHYIYKNFYGDGKADAEAKRDKYLKQHSTMSEGSFDENARYYIYNVLTRENLSPSTISLYETQYRRVISNADFKMKPLPAISAGDMQSFINGLDIAPSALSNTIKCLKHMFTYFERMGYCQNLMNLVTMPKKKPKPSRIITFTTDEMHKILSTPNRLHLLFLFAFTTGLRRGELLALTHDDIYDNAVHVNKALEEVYIVNTDGTSERKLMIQNPKSVAGIRTVPLPDSVMKEYEDYENDYEHLFTTNTGNFIDPANFRRTWKRHLLKCEVPYKKFHACRATYCTMLCKNGVSLETASKLMGHSDINITASFYRAVGNDEMRSAANAINGLLSKPFGDNLAISQKIKKVPTD